MLIAAAIVFGLVVAAAVGLNVWAWRRFDAPPQQPQQLAVDHTVLIAETLTKAVSETAEAIGRAVQAAQFAPQALEPPERPSPADDSLRRQAFEDATDPTDGVGWLARVRPIVSLSDDPNPFGAAADA